MLEKKLLGMQEKQTLGLVEKKPQGILEKQTLGMPEKKPLGIPEKQTLDIQERKFLAMQERQPLINPDKSWRPAMIAHLFLLRGSWQRQGPGRTLAIFWLSQSQQ
jgi:hypothetical protein